MRGRPGLLALASLLLSAAPGLASKRAVRPDDRPVILVDPGHGGADSGAVGQAGTLEKTVALATAQHLAAQLRTTGRYRVILTRTRDVFVPLGARLHQASVAHAALMISIHADAATTPGARGASVYVRSPGPGGTVTQLPAHRGAAPAMAAALEPPQPGSELFQRALLSSLDDDVLLRPSPARRAHLHVLAATGVPSVLVELGYITNRQDEALLRNPRHIATVAQAITDAVEDYFQRAPAAKAAVASGAEPAHHRAGEILGGRRAAQVARAHPVRVQRAIDRRTQPPGHVRMADVIQHQPGRQQQCGRVRHALACDVRRGSVHRLENGPLLADIRPRRGP